MSSRSAPRQGNENPDVRREAERAAAAAGLSVDEWLTRLIRSHAAEAPQAAPARSAEPAQPGPARGNDGQPVGRIIDSLDRLGDRIRALSSDRTPRQPHLAAVADSRSRDLQRAIEEITAQRDQIERRRAAVVPPPHLQPVPTPAADAERAVRPELKPETRSADAPERADHARAETPRAEPPRAAVPRMEPPRPEAPRAEARRPPEPRQPEPRRPEAEALAVMAAAAPAPVPVIDMAAAQRIADRLDARIGDLAATLPPREHFETVREEIVRLRDVVAANAAKPALIGLTRSYDTLVERLDAIGRSDLSADVLTELVSQMAAVRELIAAIPGESHHRLLTARLDELAARVEGIATDPGGRDIAALEGQLAQLARAVAGLDPARLVNAVESRLDGVAMRIGEIEGRMGRLDLLPQVARNLEAQGSRIDDFGRRLEALPELLRDIDARLAAVDSVPDAVARDLDGLRRDVRDDLAGLSERLEPVEALPAQLGRDIGAVRESVRNDMAAVRADVQRGADTVRADVATLRDDLRHSSETVRADVEAVIARIDDMGEKLAGLDLGSVDAGVLAAFDGRFADLANRIDRLGDETDSEVLAALELRVAALAERMEDRLAALDRSTGAAFEALGRQLDTRAMAGDPATGLQLAELGRKLDTLASRKAEPFEGAALAGIEVRLEEIGARIGSIETAHGGPQAGDLAGALGRIELAVAALVEQVETARPDDMAGIARAVEALRADLAERASPSLGGLEAEIRQIAGRLDQLAAGAPVPAAFGDEIEARIGRLIERIDAQGRDDDRLAAALGSVEQTIAAALDPADLAEAAARAAVAAFSEREGSAVAAAIRALGRDLEGLQQEIQATRQRDLELLDSMNGILQSVSGFSAGRDAAPAVPPPARGGDDETWREIERSLAAGLAGAQPAAPKPAAAAPNPSILDDLIAPRGAGRRPGADEAPLDLGENAAEGFDADRPLEPGSGKPRVVRPAAGTAPQRGDRRPAPAQPQGSLLGEAHKGAGAASASAAEPKVDPRGQPPARAARPKAPEVAADAPTGGRTDFIAAARRAAQQAASEQAGAVNPPAGADADPLADEAAGSGGLRGFLTRHRRQILMAAAALVLTLGVVRVVGWTLGGSEPAARPVAASGETSATPAAVPAATAEKIAAEADAAESAAEDDSFDVVVAPPTAGAATGFGPSAAPLPANGFAAPAGDGTAMSAEGNAIDAAAVAAAVAAGQPPAATDGAIPETLQAGAPATGTTSPARATGPLATDPLAAAPLTGGPRVAAPMPPETVGSAALREAAAGGDPLAQFEIAARLIEGRGAPQDVAAAAAWYQRAAEAGLAPAQYRLGSLYEKGQGVPRDARRAVAWYERAAEAGNAKAMHNLAVMQTEGSLGEPDYGRAAASFIAAADLGVRDSQYNLGILYARGLGVTRDLATSYKWFAIAAAGGDADAAKKRDDIAQALDSDTLARARLAVETWKPKPLDAAANDVAIDNPAWLLPPTAAAASGGDMVARAQALLAQHGFDPGPADGKMGRRTRDAIVAFQKQRGLPETGTPDAALLEALAERSI